MKRFFQSGGFKASVILASLLSIIFVSATSQASEDLYRRLSLIIAGLISNLEMFADTERYGFTFYATVFVLTLLGMLVGGIFPKLLGINNYQARTISLETGLRNATLAMAIALLIQDYMGDLYISMFFTSGLFGLWMYVAGFLSIAVYKQVLPLELQVEPETSM
jgi:predicted Na+-dependent transporter